MKTARLAATLTLCVILLATSVELAAADPAAVLPVPGPVLRGFDPPARPWLPGHRGVDLGAAPGAPVRTAVAGRVVFAADLAGRGVVVVSHGVMRTTYEPVTAIVDVGTSVGAGDRIGTLQAGHSCSTGCLHWGLRRGEEYLNPLSLLDPGPLQLLPNSAYPRLAGRAWFDLW